MVYALSYRRQREAVSSWNVGYARTRQMARLNASGPAHLVLLLLSDRDAWAKQKDLSPPEAKWLYVETLQKVCFSRAMITPLIIIQMPYRYFESILAPQWRMNSARNSPPTKEIQQTSLGVVSLSWSAA